MFDLRDFDGISGAGKADRRIWTIWVWQRPAGQRERTACKTERPLYGCGKVSCYGFVEQAEVFPSCNRKRGWK